MIDHCNLLTPDLFQQLVTWLGMSMQSQRAGRRFLETNPLLLGTETDRELARLSAAYAEERPDMKQQMASHLALLRDVRRRGGDVQAIREAYINIYGGMVLDLPSWLAHFEEQQIFLCHFHRPERTSRTRIALLREALQQADLSDDIAPELSAALRNELGRTLTHEYHPLTHRDCQMALDEALDCHESSLLIYTFARFPLQYANTCIHLGTTWLQYAVLGLTYRAMGRRGNARAVGAIERALACFAAALCVYQRAAFPEQWARLQVLLGRAYTLLQSGEPAENIERAIGYHEQALEVASPETLPTLWALIQTLLGDAYRLREKGERAANFASAIVCYKTAQQVFSRTMYPVEWAVVHIGLACIYQDLAGKDARELDKHQRCALVCYETALKVYTPDTFPLEHATTQLSLGDLHSARQGGDQAHNLKQSIACYQAALQVYTSDAFPLKHSEVQQKLVDVQARYASAPVMCHR